MQTRQMMQTLKELVLIEKYIKRGARVPIVKAQFPNIPEKPIRELYQTINGEVSQKGLTPDSSLTMNKTHDQILHANTFYTIYNSIGGREIFSTINPETLLEAYDQYRNLCVKTESSLPFTTVWYVGRDIRAKILSIKYCRVCGLMHLYSITDDRWHNCPYCKIARRGKGRGRRAESMLKKGKVTNGTKYSA